jgi:hypothetical protein
MEDIIRKSKIIENLILVVAAVILTYLLISLYFTNHFFLNTVINGVNVSLKSHASAGKLLREYSKSYELQLFERDGSTEKISGQDIELQYNEANSITKIYRIQNPFQWLSQLFRKHKYYVKDIYRYDEDALNQILYRLRCYRDNVIEPRNVSFIYYNGSYDLVKEEYGNKINKVKLAEVINKYILNGQTKLDLDKMRCYENPKYTLDSRKTRITQNVLNKYVSAKITYKFGNKIELIDGNVINGWLSVDDNLDVIIDKAAIKEYIKALCKKYDTFGAARSFKTSTNKTVEVKGGLYGWKINQKAEAKALLENISRGQAIVKEPVYARKAFSRGENDLGNTYVEINITKQYLWYYKNGKLITRTR